MTTPLTPDLCFIGGASSVEPAIGQAVASGLSVAVVEPGETDGTRAARLGALAFNAAGCRADALARSAELGTADVAAEIDFRKLARLLRNRAAAAETATAGRFAALGVRMIRAEARFKNPRTLVAGEVELRARRFVIATGTLPAPPAIEGLDPADCLTEETAFALQRRPGHLLALGGRPATLELAQAFRRLGSEVTVIAAEPLLADHDPEMAAVVLRSLAAEGVTILERTTVTEVQRKGRSGMRVQLVAEGGMTAVEGTHILAADRRTPNLKGLDLDRAGIGPGDDGIQVSPQWRTANRRVYAIGDVTGDRALASVVGHQAALLVGGLAGGRDEPADASLIPRLVLTDPQLARVGVAEAEAARSHPGARLLRWPYAENDRALAEGRTAGHVKLVVGREGRILGAAVAGANAAEAIGFWTLALSRKLAVGDIAGLALPACTFSEIGKRAAISYFQSERRASIGRKLAGLLRVFG